MPRRMCHSRGVHNHDMLKHAHNTQKHTTFTYTQLSYTHNARKHIYEVNGHTADVSWASCGTCCHSSETSNLFVLATVIPHRTRAVCVCVSVCLRECVLPCVCVFIYLLRWFTAKLTAAQHNGKCINTQGCQTPWGENRALPLQTLFKM